MVELSLKLHRPLLASFTGFGFASAHLRGSRRGPIAHFFFLAVSSLKVIVSSSMFHSSHCRSSKFTLKV
jgi:hypothetical protein